MLEASEHGRRQFGWKAVLQRHTNQVSYITVVSFDESASPERLVA